VVKGIVLGKLIERAEEACWCGGESSLEIGDWLARWKVTW